ncbi:hypothetical protein BGZ70_000952 [Mortierella alpina]|uniref:Uncharacterized protein n=1 Tax=Mortierella alpina TaxID=64518 RepID=A0A9P6IWT0_MORAP|nr:hypothetical protein BGZ70_000952 [Mortierella alpina]
MLPRNVLAIRKALGTATEILISTTPKSSQAMLLDYPSGSYTGMRTVNRIGILDFSVHTTRLANSLRQIQFPGATAQEEQAVAAGLASLRQDEVMKKETTNLVRTGLLHYYKQLKQDLPGNTGGTAAGGDDVKVTVLCTWDPEKQQPVLAAHFEPLKSPSTPHCKVEVHGSPRKQATAKNSQWVRDRSAILASMSKDSNEALLVDDATQDVYEGLSSNFFVLHRKRQSIITAPLGSVLEGTIMRSVIRVCKEKSIPVEYSFPNLKHIDEWEGAFLSSMSRLVLPIEKLILPGGRIKQFESSPTIESIRDSVEKECQNRVENLLSESDL